MIQIYSFFLNYSYFLFLICFFCFFKMNSFQIYYLSNYQIFFFLFFFFFVLLVFCSCYAGTWVFLGPHFHWTRVKEEETLKSLPSFLTCELAACWCELSDPDDEPARGGGGGGPRSATRASWQSWLARRGPPIILVGGVALVVGVLLAS